MTTRKFHILAALCLIWSTASGQETKLKQVDTEKSYEEYSVLASDKKIKHGPYSLFFKPFIGAPHIQMTGNYHYGKKSGPWVFYYDIPPNQIKEAGHYKDDLKDSLWVTYYPEDKISELFFNQVTQAVEITNLNTRVRSKEYYKEGKPSGTWEFYSFGQQQEQVYDFNSDSLLFDIHRANKPKEEPHDALFIGGDFRLKLILNEAFDFHGLMKGVNNTISLKSGKLKIELTISPNGEMQVRELENTINNEKIVKRAFFAVDSLKGFWVPGQRNTSRVITFSINQSVTHTPQHYRYSKTVSVDYSIDL
ncbi:MAG: hypothetical protein JNN04_17505 [Cyclobacteriaceae bacterium]|nr:hypothetical protein [Cyclobacteriaceae bacterium]